MTKVAVLGGGSWGTAMALLLAKKGHSVEMWLRNEEQVEDIKRDRENKKYLPGPIFPENLTVSSDIEKTILGKDIIVLATSSHGIRGVLNASKSIIKKDQIITNLSKGIENDSLMTISQVVEEILPDNKFVALSGPTHAEEVAVDIPTTIVSASRDKEAAEYIQDVFMTDIFRVYTNPDVIGVELGGALKNVIALAAGISDGLNYGDNTKAALMTRGVFEMTRLGEKMGAHITTFSGLAGIGDLIVTCTSMHSRNRRAGILIGQGASMEEAVEEIGMVVEGIRTCKSTYNLAKKYGVEMPISQELYRVLYEGSPVRDAVPNLMGRDRKFEMKDIVSNKEISW